MVTEMRVKIDVEQLDQIVGLLSLDRLTDDGVRAEASYALGEDEPTVMLYLTLAYEITNADVSRIFYVE